jgi:hypothetical protein
MPFARIIHRRRWPLIALVLVVGISVPAAAATMASAPHPASRGAAQAAVPGPAVIHHQDPRLGVTVDYPKSWRVVSSAGVLLLEAGQGDDVVLIRKTTLHANVNATNVADFRTVTDGILGDPRAHLKMLDTGRVEVGGLPGVFYLYTFPFGSGRGMQAQYFVFQGRDLYTVVFQAGHAEQFAALAPSFGALLASFHLTAHQAAGQTRPN